MEDETELYNEDGSTPSQVALDQQQQSQKVLAAAVEHGKLQLAAAQVTEAIKTGGDGATGRELLGRLDAMAQGQGSDDELLYQDFTRFMRMSSQASAPRQAAPAQAAPAKRATDLNKARRDYSEGKTNVYPG